MCTTVGNTVGGLGHESSHCTGGQQARLDILWAGGGEHIPKQQYLEIFFMRPYFSPEKVILTFCRRHMPSVMRAGKWLEVPLFSTWT